MSDHENNVYECESNSDEDKIPINVYPLKHTWVVYDHTKSDSDSYDSSTRKICEFDSVIKFWQIFNNYPLPSKLFNNGSTRPLMNNKEITSISVFKKGILPKWEDPNNQKGAEVSKRKFNKKKPLEEIDINWLNLLMYCIGSNIDSSVTGVRVVDSSSIKKNESNDNSEFKLLYRIELWFDDISKREIIEEQFKNILNIEDPRMIYYKEHKIKE